LIAVAGCAVMTRLHRPYAPERGSVPSDTPEDGYHDYVGVIHVHTTYSHDAMGTFEDAVRVANAQRLDYLITTEHNNLQALRDGRQGWHGGTLFLIGMEISASGGHYIAMGVTEEINRHVMTTQQIIDEVNRQGGFGFIAHPFFKKGRWTDWSVTGFTGIEAYNVAHDTLDENRARLVMWTLTVPAEPFYLSILQRPYDPLSTWDEMIRRHGRVVGIGSSDAHEFHLFGLKFAPYEVMFQFIRTHVLVPSQPLEASAVYDALRQGHAYFSIELLAEAKGFSFMARNAERLLGIMGDEVMLEPHLRLTAVLPAPAQLTLFKDGQPMDAVTAQTWEVPVESPGVYRLEASRHDKPWIFSNPIYVLPPTPGDDLMAGMPASDPLSADPLPSVAPSTSAPPDDPLPAPSAPSETSATPRP
jgi:hypothetical protein